MPPYRKRYAKRSYGRSRSTSRRRRPMGGSFMKRARTRAFANLRTGGLLAIERKFSDFAMTQQAVGTGGTGVVPPLTSTFSPAIAGPTHYRSAIGLISASTPTALNVLGPGDSGSDRDGRQVINDSIHIRGSVEINSANLFGGALAAIMNIVLVLDTQTNGAAPAGSAVFVNPGDVSGASPDVNGVGSFVNLSNSKRFRILKHIRRAMVPSTNAPGAADVRAAFTFAYAMDVPLKGMKTNYVADTAVPAATVASIGDNGLFLFHWCDAPATTYYHAYNSRLRFRG